MLFKITSTKPCTFIVSPDPAEISVMIMDETPNTYRESKQ